MVLDVDSLILLVEVVLGLVGSKKGYLFPSSKPESEATDGGLLYLGST